MSKISELGPITGANTRTEDLFVIVNLVQGDDGTKNITRKELVEAIQYEVFSRITITGGSIANVTMRDSVLNNVTINTSSFIAGDVDRSTFRRGNISDTNIVTSTFDNGSLTNSTGDNIDLTNSTFDAGAITNSTGDVLTITNSTFDAGALTNSTGNNIDLINSTFANGAISDSTANNLTIDNSTFDNGTIDNTVIQNSQFNTGTIDNSDMTGSRITNTELTGVTIEDSTMATTNIVRSDFSDGTGNNNVFTNTTVDKSLIQNSIIANTQFQGGLNNVTINDAIITSSFASNTGITESTFQGRIEDSTIANSIIEDLELDNVIIRNSQIIDSSLVDFDMDLTNQWEPNMDEDNYFAIKNVKTGETEKISYRQFYDEISRKTEKALKVHVAVDGDDNGPGTLLQPVRTLERAAELALEKAGGTYNRNGLNDAVHISVGPGTHYTKGNIKLPDDCSITSTSGQYATVIQALPGYENNNAILLGSGCYSQGFSFFNWKVDNFDYPEGGFAYAYRPGAKILRSPYVRDSSQLSNFNRLDVEPPLQPFNSKGTIADLGREVFMEPGHSPESQWAQDDEVTFSSGAYGYISWATDVDSDSKIYVRNLKGTILPGDLIYTQSGGTGQVQSLGIDDFPNPLVGRGGGVILADRRVLDTDSLYTYFLAFGATPRTQNGIGYVARDGAGVNGIGSLSIFVRVAFYALNGGQMTLNNSGTQFGDISMRAKGSTTIFAPRDTTATLVGNTTFADSLEERAPDIIEDMVEYLTANTANGGLGFQAYDSDKCRRDTGIIVDSVGYDVALNTNYWGRLNGLTYRSPISQIVYGEQLTETAGAIRHLQDEIEYIFRNADSSVIERANTSFQATLDILEYGENYTSPLFFTDTGNVGRTAARELIQNNVDLIAEEFIDWIENNENFFAYDSSKCTRDIEEYILPAVKYDMLLDTNYNAVTAGNAYYMATTRKVIGEQRNETVGAYKYLRQKTDELLQANSSAATVDAYEAFSEVINILDNSGEKFTPFDVSYNPVTGIMVVTFAAPHGLSVGTRILIKPESMIFTCASDGFKTELRHPRPSEKVAYQRALPILAITPTTITVNVGVSPETSEHRWKKSSISKNAISVLGSEITFSDNSNISANKRNARKQLQANRTYIQDYMMAYIDDNYFLYDSDKCRRDTAEYILPAVERDMMLGTNFNSIQSGIAYYSATASEVVGEQLTETAGSLRYLRDEIANTSLITDSSSTNLINEAFNEIIGIMENEGRLYTPQNAVYDPLTGEMELTIGSHDMQVGQKILIADESMTFECGSPAQEIVHPRPTDPAYRTPLTILETTGTTIKVNVGDANGYTGAHTFVAAVTDCIKLSTYTGRYTPTAANYDPITGVMEVTIGQHNLQVGKYIEIEPYSMTFECGSPAQQISHPRIGDPAYKTPLKIDAVSSTTITVNVGNAGGYSGAHTFISAEIGAINADAITWSDPAQYVGYYTPTNATYDPVTGVTEITIGTHSLTTGQFVELLPYSFTFECGSPAEEISHPRVTDPAYRTPLEITATSATTITVNSGTANGYTGAHTFISASTGAVAHVSVTTNSTNAKKQLQANKTFIQDEVVAYINANYFTYDGEKCTRDTGLILDAVKRDILTGSNFSSVFAGLAYRSGNASTDLVVTDQLTETVGAITWLKGEIGSSLSGTPLTRSNAAFDEIIDIMNNGQGSADAITYTSDSLGTEELEARQALQANKTFLQDEITAWIALNYPNLTYDVAKCERDVGYLVDSISFDIQYGGNTAAINNARLYYDNAVSVLPADQRVPTAEAFRHIADVASKIVRGETITPTTGNATSPDTNYPTKYTPTDATYDPITGISTITFGSSHGLSAGDYILIDDNAITFNCGSPPQQISHPRSTDPISGDYVKIDSVTSTTITIFVGDANGYTGAHTFVSAVADSITRGSFNTAERTRSLIGIIADMVEYDDFNALPAVVEPDLSVFSANNELVEAFEYVNGVREKYGVEIIDHIREQYNGLAYNETTCRRDIGYIVDALSQDVEYGGNDATITAAKAYFERPLQLIEGYPEKQTLPASTLDTNIAGNAVSNYVDYIKSSNTLPLDQREPTRLAYVHMADIVEDIITETAVANTAGNITPQDVSGVASDATTALSAKNLLLTIANSVDNYSEPSDLPEISGSPAITPRRTYARKQIQQNRDFLIEEVISFINDQYFTYNEGKCERDAAYILDAVKRDILTGSNYNSIYAGLAYRAGTVGTDIVINEQLAETLEGFKFIQAKVQKQVTGDALTRANDAFDNLFNVMTNGASVAPTYIFGTARISTNNLNASQGLKFNRAFMIAEITAWIGVNYPSLVYDVAKCERDVGYMVDAACFDIQHGSNVAMKDVANLYFENAVSVLPKDQKDETAAAFVRLATIAEQIVLKQTVSKSPGNALNQDTTSFGGTVSSVGQAVEDLFLIVSDVITRDSLSEIAASVDVDAGIGGPLAVGYDAIYQSAFSKITAITPTVQSEIVAYLNNKFDYLEYDETKCRRDTGYIIDAISHDIQYGGNAAIVNCAGIYFENAINVLDLDQREPTRRAFTHLAEVLEKVIYNETVIPSPGNTETQDITLMPGANPQKKEIATEAKNLALIIANIADDKDPSNLPIRIDPDLSWVAPHLKASKETVETNSGDLIDDMIRYISRTYNGLSFPREQCRRDMGFIVDAISHDVNYTTNYATRIVSQIYFENGISVLPEETREQTADVYEVMGAILSDIVQEIDTTPSFAVASSQDTSGTPATATEGAEVAGLIKIIEDVIRNDTLSAIPDLVEPDTSWVSAERIWAADTIDANKADLAADVQKWIGDNFTVLDYNKAKCRRDVELYILPAFSFDLNYGGNAATRWNADFYYWNNILRIPENQRIPTAQAYRQLGVICKDIVLGKNPKQAPVDELATSVEADKCITLSRILYETLYNNDTKRLPALDLPDFDWETDNNGPRFARDILVSKRKELQSEVVRFVNKEYKFLDINLTRRDGLNILLTLANDFRFINTAITSAPGYGGVEGKGSSKATRTFVASFFNYDGTHVFPVFNPVTRGLNFKGTVQDINTIDTGSVKLNDAYIVPSDWNGNRYSGTVYYWNGTIWINDGANNDQLLYAFYKSWERMRDYITGNLNGGLEENAMINGLFNEILIGNVLRPDTLVFGSLVESIAHQFNGASAGVNRTALPLNFRNIGLPISALASVLSEDGGRVRWSGADELNNQYFARGLRINGRTGRIEGRPFTSSVRKLARRASNSRAIV